jgi:hypothetical protein
MRRLIIWPGIKPHWTLMLHIDMEQLTEPKALNL